MRPERAVGASPEGPGDAPVSVRVRGVHKRFPGVHALRGVDLDLISGEVRGLVGENGAGKSSLVKVLAGAYTPDEGFIEVSGRPVAPGSPAASRAAGIAVIHQEPNIVPALSPVANAFLGQVRSRAGVLSEGAMRRRFREWCDQLGITLPVDTPAGALSTAGQQAVEIIRALEQGARIVLMDEPTAALGPSERAALIRMIALLRERGATMMFISHHLEEVLELCTAITVLRDGETVCTVPTEEATVNVLVTAMLGEKLDETRARIHTRTDGTGRRPEVLRAEGVCVPGRLQEVGLSVCQGEILGIAGLIGSGRSTLVRALAGAEPTATGRMVVEGREVAWPRTPRQALRRGVALAPEDRRGQGLVLSRSGAENVVLPTLSRIGRWGFMRRRQVMAAATAPARDVRFSPERLVVPARALSGGNQQKLLLAKWLTDPPRVLIVDEPTRGVDVGGKAEIFRTLAELAGRGIAVIMVSEEAEELIALTDRVLVLCNGEEAGTFEAPMELDAVVTAMFPASNGRERPEK